MISSIIGTNSVSYSDPINPSSINLPRFAGPRPHLSSPPEASKKFRPNLGGGRTRAHPESTKEDRAAECVHRQFRAEATQPGQCEQGHADAAPPEGAGVVEEGDPEEAAPERVSTNSKKIFNGKFFEANYSASTLSSPAASSIELSESITELDLAQETCEEVSAQQNPRPLKNLLHKLAREEGLVCTSVNRSSLTFKCPGNHTFSASSSETAVCPQCEIMKAKCLRHAKLHNGNYVFYIVGKLLTENYEGSVEFECEKGHVWKVNYSER
eukprot:TRINITY_DN2273_c0_g1_i3.p1 TRINITY_DN2273_c0_g1~~TRINITY_DN2273_c0_g1_i3.p1  ORF type:complete len:269 (+),score=26.51 TRINITY_DN2273_c0_g1_i3:128-934(+)